ncbi:hypothetical protein BC940DRAFT_298352, partial [Gongronella butleri]
MSTFEFKGKFIDKASRQNALCSPFCTILPVRLENSATKHVPSERTGWKPIVSHALYSV